MVKHLPASLLLFACAIISAATSRGDESKSLDLLTTSHAPLQSLPAVEALPDLWTFNDGRPVKTPDDWRRRREELKAALLYYQYGSMPPRPDRVTVVESNRRDLPSGLGTAEEITLEISGMPELRFRALLRLPKHSGRRPVIVREEGTLGRTKDASMFLKNGYIFIEYARHDLDPDADRVVGPAQAAYPNHDWGTLAVWAWCGMRLVDYLETRDDVDMERIAITGHSRGGKMALLAGALDERFALVVPHQSGAGGAGCYRVLGPGAETLAQNDKPHWYHERIRWFGKQAERLPLDQHFLKALVAPRALLCTESIDDEFANPLGSLVTSVVAQPVFEMLGAGENNGIHFRRGDHSTKAEDWARLLQFAQWRFFGKEPQDRSVYWRAPIPLPPGYRDWTIERALHRDSVSATENGFAPPPAAEAEVDFVRIGSPGNASDQNHHGQGEYGAVDQPFEIAVHQVTHVEYARFLNCVAREDPNGLYHRAMASAPGAILRTGETGDRRYLVRESEPPTSVRYVSWFDAARYCNWLHHGKPCGAQGPTTTEEGAYRMTGPLEAGPRKEDARYFLPTEDQWYKAAYYSPTDGEYGHFPSSGDDRPFIDRAQPELVSPMGMDEFADSVWEWTETPVGRLHRSVRSGAWFLGNNRQAAGRFYTNPQIEYPTIGIRVARAGGD